MTRTLRLATVLSLALLGACSNGDTPAPEGDAGDEQVAGSAGQPLGRFVFSRSRCSYEGPETIAAGQVSFILVSQAGPADFDLWRLDEGHAYEELVAHIDEEVRRSEQGLPELGHPTFATLVAEASTDLAGDGTLTTSVDAGVYGMACIRFGGNGAFVTAGPFVVR